MGISGCGMDWPIRGFLESRGWCSWLVSNPIVRGGLNVVRRHSGACMVAAEHRDILVELVVKWSGGGGWWCFHQCCCFGTVGRHNRDAFRQFVLIRRHALVACGTVGGR